MSGHALLEQRSLLFKILTVQRSPIGHAAHLARMSLGLLAGYAGDVDRRQVETAAERSIMLDGAKCLVVNGKGSVRFPSGGRFECFFDHGRPIPRRGEEIEGVYTAPDGRQYMALLRGTKVLLLKRVE